QAVGSSKLSKWHRSHSGVTCYGYKQTVKDLAAAGSYRAVVRFRWYDADHNVIRRAKRVSEACVQKGELPNLVIAGVHIAPGMAPGSSVYRVSFANTGKGDAEDFTVALFVDGALADSRRIARLDAGKHATVDLNGPRGEIEVVSEPLVSWIRRHRLLRLPIVRGVVALAESLKIGFRALGISASAQAGTEDEEIGRGTWAGTVAVSVVFAVGLFFLVP